MRRFHDMPFGAGLSEYGTCEFRLWAPAAKEVAVRLGEELFPLTAAPSGWWSRTLPARAGDAYLFRIDDRIEVPDPASRSQARDVHGPSLLIDPCAYEWCDETWRGRPWREAVLYEIHVGTFTPEGTFGSAKARLDGLAELGVTAIELMPVADFPGARDWGYDGVLPFAPDRRYGSPDDLKSLVEAAHQRGVMVLLDVVYNHFGPEGNYLHLYAPQFFNARRHTPWGAAINFDGDDSRTVRDFFIHNALYWLEEFHLDGLRFDAVHAVHDDSRPDILQELARAVRSKITGREIHLVLENDANEARYLHPSEGSFDAQWNDDFHHSLHVITTGEEGGYYEDFSHGPHALLARCMSEGFAFQGEHSAYRRGPRGETSRDLPVTAFVNFLQNHDQIGNRAFGERLIQLTSPEAYRAASAILLLMPAPPLLFMGQEWGSVRPFPFFCDFGAELAGQVSEGRRREFARFTAFSDERQRSRIPDPQAPETAASATLHPGDGERQDARMWRELYRGLLRLRHREIVPRLSGVTGRDASAEVAAENVLVVRWRLGDDTHLLLLANLGLEPVSDLQAPDHAPIYATPNAFGENDTLAGWAVAWYLTREGIPQVHLNGAPVIA